MSEGDARQGPPSEVRATDADRDVVVARLKLALDAGALQFDEIETRLEAVYAARTRQELVALTTDLPEESAARTPAGTGAGAWRSTTFRIHLMVYAMVMAMLIGIWAMAGGGHFWPFYPAAGWGIGLGSHFMVAAEHQRARRRRVERRRHGDHRPRAVGPPRAAPGRRHDGPPFRPAPVSRQLRGGPPGPRVFVVAMFVDVVGSTGLNEAMGDELWASERARFRALVQDCAVAEGGWEVSAAGDGVLIRFHVPAGAVRAAVAVQRRLADQRVDSFAPSVRIGIHSGDVIDEGDDIVGSVINVASRVGDVAGADEIVVTEHVADHVDDVVTTDHGLHELRGVAHPRHLLGVVWRDRD